MVVYRDYERDVFIGKTVCEKLKKKKIVVVVVMVVRRRAYSNGCSEGF